MSASTALWILATLGAAPQSPTGAELPLPRAEEILGSHGCVTCHVAPGDAAARYQPKSAPNLSVAASRLGAEWLRGFLLDPRGTKPWVTMPDLLGKLGEDDRASVAEDLTHYVLSLGEPIAHAAEPADLELLEDGRWLYREAGCVVCHGPAEPDYLLDWTLAELWEAENPPEGPEPTEGEDELWVPEGTLEPWNRALSPLVENKYTAAALESFLLDPLALRPSGHMPNMELDAEEAQAIAAYLLRARVRPQGQATRVQGLAYELFEQKSGEPDFENDKPVAKGSAAGADLGVRRRDDNFGLRFTGTLDVPGAGEWRFATNSDDGSMLWIDGELVVDNGGNHAPRTIEATAQLEAGPHELVLTFFEQGGGETLELLWAAPGSDELIEIPVEAMSHLGLGVRPLEDGSFQVDPRRARAGKALFSGMGCAACHTVGDPAIDDLEPVGTAAGPSLGELAGLEPMGCLAVPAQSDRAARYALDPADQAAVLGYLAGDLPVDELAAGPRLARQFQRMNCYGCHRRDELGGVHPAIKEYFVADEEAEVGDEARYPPPLTGVGAKLRVPALHGVLLEAERVRPYVAVRMPQYGEEAVGWMPAAFEAADRSGEAEPARGQDLTPERLAMAQHLAGREGLGCIQCHDFAGVASLGIRAVDMAGMHDRLRPGWFQRLLRDPAAVNMNTRMANLWIDGKSPVQDVLDGDIDAQVQLVWDYLSLGSAMPYPEGLVVPDEAFEVRPTDRARSVGVFWKEVGPRVVAVGTPERVNFAFDVGASRLNQIWRGDFLNARGTWQGRAGQLEGPASADGLRMPAGPLLASLAEPGNAWPSAQPAAEGEAGEDSGDGPPAGGSNGDPDSALQVAQALGREIDGASGLPAFRYDLLGLEIIEALEPRIAIGGAGALRRVEVSAAVPPEGRIWLRVATGDSIAVEADGAYAITGEQPHTVRFERVAGEPQIVSVDGASELRVPLELTLSEDSGQLSASFAWEIQW